MKNLSAAAVPLMLVAAALMMIIPIPAMILDILLAANITLSVVILMTVLTLRDTLDLSVFPSLVLVSTMFRLGLNVSSTRLILLDGHAGKVIESFGNFVIGGSVFVGLTIFLILIVIQFVVITNGAGRVAEVGARFALDAMPGKQMAIDADLASGMIDEATARERRKRISNESTFFGAMDGATKFVKGDAMAAIIMVAINLLGGLAIGVVQRGMPINEAINTYALMTVGEGLVSQISALLMSIATALLVTRVGNDDDLGPNLSRQLFSGSRALQPAALVVAVIGLMPGLPKIPFILLAAGLFVLSGRADKKAEADAEEAEAMALGAGGPLVSASADDPEALIAQLRVEPLELHLAYDILDLIDPGRGGDLLDRVRALRSQIAMELGVVMPSVRTRDDVSLPPATYVILLSGVEVARGTAPQDRVLALPAGDGSELHGLAAEATTEPVFGLAAFWVPAPSRPAAIAAGATVVDRSAVIVTHLAEVVRNGAGELLSRQHVQMLVESLRVDEPLLAGEVGGELVPIGTLHAVLRGLLAERVGIRDLGRIVESVATRARDTRAVEHLVSAARVAIGASIVARIAPERKLGVLTLEPAIEAAMHEALRDVDGVLHLVLDPQITQALVEETRAQVAAAGTGEVPVALVVGQLVRRPLARTLAGAGVMVPVLAYPELPPYLEIEPKGVIGGARVDA